MATIPIEIILQDAESPVTPTPESGEETNIIVPDTGTISDVNNSGGIGSSASIILPAIIAVLAIGAIVAIIVRRYQKRKSNTEATKLSRKEKLATAASGTIAILAATVLVGNLVIPATKAATSVEPGTAELETEDKITIVATREADNDSDTVTATVKDTSYATANLNFGYKVTASMVEGTTTANLYLDGNIDSPYYIAPTENGDLSINSWGYMLEGGEYYQPMSLADAPATIAKGNDNIVENKPVDIYYALKADKTLLAGTYTGEIEYALTDNNFPSTLTTMQGMTTEICENTFTPGNQVTDPVPTATLEDTRDHKTYTIAKLADGKCWMTQNLDLDLKDDVTLTPADTNVSENWTPLRNTIQFTGEIVDGWQSDYSAPYSADPGDVYYYTSGTDANDTQYDSLAECEAVHNDDTCQHYHAGNYYNWSAAVASNDTSGMATQYENAPDSICPAGWRLPASRNSTEKYSGDLNNLLLHYSDILDGEFEPYKVAGYYLTGSGFNAIRKNPLWLVRAGHVAYSAQETASKLMSNTEIGGTFSSTIEGGRDAFYFGISYDSDGAGVSIANKEMRDRGFAVRCIAR